MIEKFIKKDGRVRVILFTDVIEIAKTEEGIIELFAFWEKQHHDNSRTKEDQNAFLPRTEAVIKMVEEGKLIQTERPDAEYGSEPEQQVLKACQFGMYEYRVA